MKHLFGLVFFSLLLACTETISEPTHKINSSEMAEIIAEISLSENLVFQDSEFSTQAGFDEIMKKHKTSPLLFKQNYEYYLSKGDELSSILKQSQEIIKTKDAKFNAFLKSNGLQKLK